VAKKIVSAGGRAIAAAGDIMSSDTIKRIINAAAKLEENPLHRQQYGEWISWRGAGGSVERDSRGTVSSIKLRINNREGVIMNLHTKAPFQFFRAAAPHFRVKDGEPRSIINASWLQGNVYNPPHPPTSFVVPF